MSRITSETALAGLYELLRPSVIQAQRNARLAAELGNTAVTAQAFQHNPDLVFSLEMPTRGASYVFNYPLGTRFGFRGFGSLFAPSSLR